MMEGIIPTEEEAIEFLKTHGLGQYYNVFDDKFKEKITKENKDYDNKW